MRVFLSLFKSPMFVFGLGMFLLLSIVSLFYPIFTSTDPMARAGMPFAGPSLEYWLGTNNQGQNVFARLVFGLRSSLYVGLAAGVTATILGTVIGLFSGYVGGKTDNILSMTTNLFLVIPSIVILILISNSLNQRSLTLVALIIGATTWTWTARAVRAQALSLRHREHVNLAKLNGEPLFSLIFTQIMPYMMSYIFMAFIIQMATGILSEAAISMLGLGPYDTVTLGQILNNAQQNEALTNGNWWVFMPAAILVTIVTFSLYLINTAMEGVFNPRLRT